MPLINGIIDILGFNFTIKKFFKKVATYLTPNIFLGEGGGPRIDIHAIEPWRM